ncbi:hypothetical protein O6H91_03G110500 [Diphasiastrum complanatum]|uniref:Uncharacterized protein n=1 Tax=Diphasiastrum complanatum TaxID=34168 RepID=A0ACC2EAG0_DIPCM|nr:hypothetical protein O6H91_03G110500 [Diphasiastrum complanatum]
MHEGQIIYPYKAPHLRAGKVHVPVYGTLKIDFACRPRATRRNIRFITLNSELNAFYVAFINLHGHAKLAHNFLRLGRHEMRAARCYLLELKLKGHICSFPFKLDKHRHLNYTFHV